MTTTADIVLDSVNEAGVRLTTFKLRYPRFIHQQLLMHRTFSRSCSSSRAIPTVKLIDEVLRDPAPFDNLGKNISGMQPGEALDEETMSQVRDIIEEHRNFSILCAKALADLKVHKQWVNRLLEPHSHISVVLTTTHSDESLYNLFALRISKDAQSAFEELALKMIAAIDKSKPQLLLDGEWHIPWVTEEERSKLILDIQLKVSSARSARTSYNRHDDQSPDVAKDIALADKLYQSRHSNPFEHCAMANQYALESDLCGNFKKGWVQYRKILEKPSAAIY